MVGKILEEKWVGENEKKKIGEEVGGSQPSRMGFAGGRKKKWGCEEERKKMEAGMAPAVLEKKWGEGEGKKMKGKGRRMGARGVRVREERGMLRCWGRKWGKTWGKKIGGAAKGNWGKERRVGG